MISALLPTMPRLTLLSSDGESLSAHSSITTLSPTINRQIEALPINEKDSILSNKSPLPIAKVVSRTLKYVIEWCTHHKNGDPNEDPNDVDAIPEWDRQLVKKMENSDIVNVILAAKHLEINELFLVGCKAVAKMFEYETSHNVNKRTSEIRETFGIVNDLSPEEETKIKEETEWIKFNRFCEHCCDNDCDCREHFGTAPFPLMTLTDDVIAVILQQLTTALRLRGRVNKRLKESTFQIESGTTFRIKELSIVPGESDWDDEPDSLTIGLASDNVEGILRKIAQNSTVDNVTVTAQDASQGSLSGLIPLIISIPSRELTMQISQFVRDFGPTLWELSDDSLYELVSGREFINLPDVPTDLTDTGLYRLFNDMECAQISLRRIILNASHPLVQKLLRLIGITFTHETWTSTREDVKIFSAYFARYLVIGPSMLITIQKDGDLIVERQNEDGSLPAGSCFRRPAVQENSIQGIVSDFTALTVAYNNS
ncbi:hypothetical protein PRIPAC_75046 [Pristionchus pacificus]|uniref:Uncharacterized protein n=1 Tax=Pristionchus pacificus TaxID=54126 RepID=A0A2A6C0Q6_PRIPA|nr:hypothetical protein PRIPAC_75046 [Pristionchus pacificus]|eukprot:PDM71754.1 hypothetical protein PRIPAC_38161 [Pristionchus pacificus]